MAIEIMPAKPRFSRPFLLADFFVAMRFLTIFPFPAVRYRGESLARSMGFFPLAGLFTGAFSLGLFFTAAHFLPARIAVLILLIAPVVISGGLHADGFADACDGLFGGKSPEDRLRIMKDSRIGTFGALGLIFLVLLKYQLLDLTWRQPVFFLYALALSRWGQVFMSYFFRYAGQSGGLAESVAGKVRKRELMSGLIFLLPFLFYLSFDAVFIFIGAVVLLSLLGIFFNKMTGGITGDLLGASSELVEVFVMIYAAVLVWRP